MKFSASAASFLLAIGIVDAFPHMALEELQRRAKIDARSGGSASGVPIPDPAQLTGYFDPKLQYVSNTGDHAFMPPGQGDQRGPCPGLNAMANHNYIPRNGVGTIAQFIAGTDQVFGMGVDLGGFLSVYGAAMDGDLTSWSIGGPTGLIGLGGTGLIGSHNKYEADASPTRPDLYEFGNNYEINWDQWKALYNKQAGVPDDQANYNLAVLQEYRSERFDQSVNNNPYFFNGPFSGIAVQPAAYTFIYRFMANKSAEHPDGILNREVLKAFFGVTENSDGSFSGGTGYEYIPDNWYKRAIGDEYTIPFFVADLNYEALVYPKFFSVGGNLGKPNTFTPVDVGNLTGGVYNAGNLLKGNNLFCFAYESVQNALPDVIIGLVGSLANALQKYAPDAAKAITTLDCPQLAGINQALLNQYPGYTKGGNVI